MRDDFSGELAKRRAGRSMLLVASVSDVSDSNAEFAVMLSDVSGSSCGDIGDGHEVDLPATIPPGSKREQILISKVDNMTWQ